MDKLREILKNTDMFFDKPCNGNCELFMTENCKSMNPGLCRKQAEVMEKAIQPLFDEARKETAREIFTEMDKYLDYWGELNLNPNEYKALKSKYGG